MNGPYYYALVKAEDAKPRSVSDYVVAFRSKAKRRAFIERDDYRAIEIRNRIARRFFKSHPDLAYRDYDELRSIGAVFIMQPVPEYYGGRELLPFEKLTTCL